MIFNNYYLRNNNNIINMSDNTVLTPASGYDVSRMRFSQPAIGTIPNSVPQISYKRINISTINPDGSSGELVLPTEQVFSFGIGENTNPDTGKVNGYVMPLCLWNRDSPTKAEKEWSETFDKIVEKCKEHLIENKDEIEQYNLERNDLKKLNPLYWKRDKGKIVEGTGPTLYAKLIVSKKQDKITSMFFDADGNQIDSQLLIGKYANVKAAIKIESIFVGTKISLQIKLYEAEVKLMDSEKKSLLQKSKPMTIPVSKPVTMSVSANPMQAADSDTGSINASDDEEDAPPKPVLKKPQEASPAPAPAPSSAKKVITKVVRKAS